MPKKKVETAVAEEEVSTAVALIEPAFNKLAEFKMPTVEESIEIITKKRKDNEALVIAGVDDKPGYEAVKLAMAQMKNDRIAFVDAATVNVITPASTYLKKFKDDLEKIANEFKAGEKDLRDKKDFIDDEKVRIKAEDELKKVQAMQLRVNDLNVLGAMFDGAVYSFGYNETLMIGAGDVKEFSDEEFSEFLEEVKTAFAEEQTRLHELKLQEEQDEFYRLAEIEKQKELAEQNKEQEKQLNNKRTALRIKELKLNGFTWNESDQLYIHPVNPLTLMLDEVETYMEESAWDDLMYDIEHFTPHVEPEKEIPSIDQTVADIETVMNAGPGDMFPAFEREFPTADNDSLENMALITPHDFTGRVTLDGVKVFDSTAIAVHLFFPDNQPYLDFDISGKLLMRVYHDEYAGEALTGIEVVANQGKLQGLNWLILSKAQAVVAEAFKVPFERDTYNPEGK